MHIIDEEYQAAIDASDQIYRERVIWANSAHRVAIARLDAARLAACEAAGRYHSKMVEAAGATYSQSEERP